MADGENTNSVSAVVFLVISILFLFMVHVNGLVFQVSTLQTLLQTLFQTYDQYTEYRTRSTYTAQDFASIFSEIFILKP